MSVDTPWALLSPRTVVPVAACAVAFLSWRARAWWMREMDFMERVAGGR